MKRMLLLLAMIAAPVRADTPLPPASLANKQLANPKQEADAKALMETLRCLVCQGQSIADSNADMAGDMRSLVRTRIAGGEKPAQVRDWLISRYGDYVSYDPPITSITVPLWLTPIVLLIVGGFIARVSFKKRARS